MLVKSGISSRGFVLDVDVEFPNPVVILTGRNGSGKTRFISAVRECPGMVVADGVVLSPNDILSVTSFTPAIGGGGQKLEISKVLNAFDKAEFDDFGNVYAPNGLRFDSQPHVTIDVLPSINFIARLLKKKAADLTHDEIELYFHMPQQHGVGGLDVSGIFNHYLQAKETNKFFEFRAKTYHENVEFLTEEEFSRRFGPEPWFELNNIMNVVFEGKFYFSTPEAGSRNYSRVYGLLNAEGNPIGIDGLSAGENVLLWLVLTIFTSMYVAGEFVTSPKVIMFDEPDAHLHPKMVEHMYWAFREFCARFKCHVILTTHSPTTVALASDQDVYVVSNGSITQISKDAAISELLVGVSRIAVNPENRRQVYVESLYDVESFQTIYDFMCGKECYALNSGVSLSFVPAGGKVPESQLRDFILRAAPQVAPDVIDEFVLGVNGVGSCTHVYGAVESLQRVGNKTVRGVVDWDGRNLSEKGVVVFSNGRAYAIENVLLDPLCLVDLLSSCYSHKYPLSSFAGEKVGFDEWSKDRAMLQRSVEVFVSKVLGEVFVGDATIEYASGISLITDQRYLYNRSENGHALERKIIDAYPELKELSKREGALKRTIANVYMTAKYSANFLPIDFQQLFQELQAT